MNHFTSTGYIVVANIPGRHGSYGSTTSVVGIFNTMLRADTGKSAFARRYAKQTNRNIGEIERTISIVPIAVNAIDEQILSKTYE